MAMLRQIGRGDSRSLLKVRRLRSLCAERGVELPGELRGEDAAAGEAEADAEEAGADGGAEQS